MTVLYRVSQDRSAGQQCSQHAEYERGPARLARADCAASGGRVARRVAVGAAPGRGAADLVIRGADGKFEIVD